MCMVWWCLAKLLLGPRVRVRWLGFLPVPWHLSRVPSHLQNSRGNHLFVQYVCWCLTKYPTCSCVKPLPGSPCSAACHFGAARCFASSLRVSRHDFVSRLSSPGGLQAARVSHKMTPEKPKLALVVKGSHNSTRRPLQEREKKRVTFGPVDPHPCRPPLSTLPGPLAPHSLPSTPLPTHTKNTRRKNQAMNQKTKLFHSSETLTSVRVGLARVGLAKVGFDRFKAGLKPV